jgi:hypothetical protein
MKLFSLYKNLLLKTKTIIMKMNEKSEEYPTWFFIITSQLTLS